MPLERQSASSQTGLLIILLVVIIAAGAWFAVKPAYTNYSEAKNQLDSAQARLEETRQDQQNVETLLTAYNSNISRIAILESSLPADLEIPQILSMLETLGLQSGLIIGSISVEDEATEALLQDQVQQQISGSQADSEHMLNTAGITLALTGSYDSFRAFLEALENNLRLFDVQLISAGEGQNEVNEFALQLNVYYQ